MPVRWLTSSGNWSNQSIWNDGALLGIPTTGDDVYTNGFTVTMDVNATVNSLNNSARARDIATPAMTANNAPSPYVAAASTVQGAGNDAFAAFNRVYTTNTGWFSAVGSTTGWLSMDFGSGSSVVIDGYTIFGNDTQTLNPRNWTLESSNDNINWTIRHTVSGAAAIAANSSYSIASIGNTTGSRYYRVNISLNGTGNHVRITELELYQPGTAALTAGGSFNFNTAGVTVTCTSTSASLSAGATNLITVTATTGTVTLNLGSSVTGLATTSTQIFNYTGNCNFNLSGVRYTGGNASNAICIAKTSNGVITVTGDLVGGGNNAPTALSSSAGNTVVIGNVSGSSGGGTGITQTAGNVTVTGNVTGGTFTSAHGISLTGAASQFTINGNVTGGTGGTAYGINFTGTSGTVNGTVRGGGGSNGHGIFSSTAGVNVTGDVIGSVGYGLQISGNCTIIGNVYGGTIFAGIGNFNNNPYTVSVTGDVYASNSQPGINLTGTGTQVVNLTGNMYNTLGRMAIYCPNVFISNTATTLWRVDTGGGDYKFLYSADTTPNLPPITDVRFGTTYGPALSLTGTMVVPAASDVRENVPVDNTVGTGELTSADIISGINASSDSLAVRLKNILTDKAAGNIISQYKDA